MTQCSPLTGTLTNSPQHFHICLVLSFLKSMMIGGLFSDFLFLSSLFRLSRDTEGRSVPSINVQIRYFHAKSANIFPQVFLSSFHVF